MVNCNLLGRGEARFLCKLEKAKEKIKKLKTRIQELETAVEAKDNEVLRALKAYKKTTRKGDIPNDVNWNSNSSSTKCLDCQVEEPAEQKNILNQNGSTASDICCPRKIEKFKTSKDMGVTNTEDDRSTTALDKRIGSCFLIDENGSEISAVMHEFSQPDLKAQISGDLAFQKNFLSRQEAALDTKTETVAHGPCNKDGVSGSRSDCKGNMVTTAAMDEDTVLLLDDIKQVQSFLHVEKETPCPVPISQSGDLCFSGGLLGPDGTKRHLGKWCKRVQGKGSAASSVSMQGSSTSSGNLIASGADGRGGRIKILRSLNQSSLNSMDTSTLAKRCKYGAKTSSL